MVIVTIIQFIYLLNESNQKAGTIKYTLYPSGTEEFKVYDLNGNLVD